MSRCHDDAVLSSRRTTPATAPLTDHQLINWINDQPAVAELMTMAGATRDDGAGTTRCGRERGATLVEASIASLLFFSVLLALFEFGWAFRDYMTTADMARNAARNGSAAGNSGTADFSILQALKKSNGALNSGQLQYVVIFDAGSATGSLSSISATCVGGTAVTNVCNVYTAADLTRASSDFGCSTSLPSPDRFWCPSARKVAASVASGGPPSFLGVYVKVKHNTITKALGNGVTFTDQSVLRIEPQER